MSSGLTGLPPGTILQLMYLKDRLGKMGKSLRFLDIGAGNGMLSKLMLSLGHSGVAVDLNAGACKKNTESNQEAVAAGKLKVINGNFLELDDTEKFDVIMASMVIEHLPDSILVGFINQCKNLLKANGSIVFFVPSSMKYWGIEDEIAGHMLRYERKDVDALAQRFQLNVSHLAGLTYPVSNWLFSLSNRIIQKKESEKLKLSEQERTVYTGNREVSYKTQFPKVFNLILNQVVLYQL